MKFLDMFRNWASVEEYDANTVIFSERDPAEVMYVILSGEVGLSLHGESLGTEREGGIIGEMAIIDSGTRSATATALNKVSLARLDRDQLRRLIRKDTDFSLHVIAVLANRLRAVDKFIITQLS